MRLTKSKWTDLPTVVDIVIPTCGRWAIQPTCQQLVAAGLHVTLVVQHAQAAEYARWATLGTVDIYTLPPGIDRISPTRQHILENVGNDRLLYMVDDDLRFFKRRDDQRDKLREITPGELQAAFLEMGDWLASGFKHAGFAAREGANRNTQEFMYHTRMMRVLGYDRNWLVQNQLRFDRTPFMQDFDMHLQILRAGGDSILLNNYAHNQGSSNAPGGCSTTRTMEKLAEAAQTLQSLHPEFVRLSERETKTAWGGGTRTDVTVSWKKAYEEGQKNGQ